MKTVVVALLFVASAILAEGFSVEECIQQYQNDPCQSAICRAYPHAKCEVNMETAWYDSDEKVDCDECRKDAPAQDCDDKVCSETTCDNHPDAPICRMYNCGMCAPEFFNPGSNDPLDCWG